MTTAKPLDPSLDFCDLCAASVWRIIVVEISGALMSPRLRAEIQKRQNGRGGRWVMTVPLCEPCATLLGCADMELAGDASAISAQVQYSPGRRADATTQEALLKLLARYEEQFGAEMPGETA